MICIYCGKTLGTNDEAEKHAGECLVMCADNSPVENETKYISTDAITNIIFEEESEWNKIHYKGIWQFEAANKIMNLIFKKEK